MAAIRSAVAETKKEVKEAKERRRGRRRRRTEQEKLAKRAEKTARKIAAKAHTRDSLQALSKLGELVDGQYQIVSQPPVIVPARDLAADLRPVPERGHCGDPRPVPPLPGHAASRPAPPARAVRDRRRGPQGRRRRQRRDPCVHRPAAGTRRHDPLFLQIKEATASVLEAYLPKSLYRQHGQRVVDGQRMMQAASDIYLGWTKGLDVNRHFYWRQLRDMKGSVEVETMMPPGSPSTRHLRVDHGTRPRPLREPVAIAAYLGASDAFEQVDHRLLAALCRPERARLRGLRQGGPVRRLQAVEASAAAIRPRRPAARSRLRRDVRW